MSLFDLFRPKGVRNNSGESVKMKNGQEMMVAVSPFIPLCVLYPDGRTFAVMTEGYHRAHYNLSDKYHSLKGLIEQSENLDDLRLKLAKYK